MSKIIMIGGSKGGTGKSTVCSAVLDYLESQGNDPILVETDTANPDVYKAHKANSRATAIELDTSEGWIDLVNLADNTRGQPLVINTAARNLTAVGKFGKTLESTLAELDRELITLWTINRQRDSLELMADYLETLPVSDRHMLHVVRNLYFGEPEKFQLYNDSGTRKRIESTGGKTVDFPDLADRVADDLATKRLSIKRASEELPIGNRAELLRWRKLAHIAIAALLS
ncbi:protein mobD [uncultured Variovorax sp.]|jgi:hypothetical protein|uniref:protein mobD n=1 Tax=uncultured Variovorax sp. TaxID=114708 RepID=UPI00260F54D5|nr:protein mobD [uncultured Variovorax sp.]